MTRPHLASIACATLLAFAGAAQAQTATFEDVALGFVNNGDVTVSNGLTFTQGGEFGGVTDNAGPLLGNAPVGNPTNYYAVMNDASVTLTRGSTPFTLLGLSYAFVSPLGGVYAPGDQPAALVVAARAATGELLASTFAFAAADANGAFPFQSLGASRLGTLSTVWLTSVTFSACSYDSFGDCVSPAFNLNQFAIDNVTAVPEPAPLALTLAGLAVVGAVARRRAAR